MKKTKLLTITIIALVILNAITLSFFISKGPNDRPGVRKMPREVVIDKLNLDAEQIVQYEELIKEHSQAITDLDNQLNEYKNYLYKELANPTSDEAADKLFTEIATTQATIEKLHYKHFLAIKKLCKPEQIEDYNQLTNELSKIFSRQPPREKHNREQ